MCQKDVGPHGYKSFSCSTQLSMKFKLIINEPRCEKTNILVSDVVRHKPGRTGIEDGWRLEISDLERRGIVLSM